jgi:hypothetical protein
MKQSFTTEDLIRLLYCECDQEEALEIAYALEDECELNWEFRHLQSMHKELSKLRCTPSKGCIENILAFSQNS